MTFSEMRRKQLGRRLPRPALSPIPVRSNPPAFQRDRLAPRLVVPTILAMAGDLRTSQGKLSRFTRRFERDLPIHLDGDNFTAYLTGEEEKGPRHRSLLQR